MDCLPDQEQAISMECNENSEDVSIEDSSKDSLQYTPDLVGLQVHRDLVIINGKINSMDRNELTENLRLLNLSTYGNVSALKKRLKYHVKSVKLSQDSLRCISKTYPYYVVVDFEATCNEINPPDFPHEIIEFPAVLVDTQKKAIVDEFHFYCKPKINPCLTKFCTDLTGISQETVNEADDFSVVFEKFELWLNQHKLGKKHKYAFVTDGPWDMCKFLHLQCKTSQLPFPNYAKKWVNIRKTFSGFYKSRKMRLPCMLEFLGVKFEGRQHCGLDDAKNIATLLLLLLKDGASVEMNESFKSLKPYFNYRDKFNKGKEL